MAELISAKLLQNVVDEALHRLHTDHLSSTKEEYIIKYSRRIGWTVWVVKKRSKEW